MRLYIPSPTSKPAHSIKPCKNARRYQTGECTSHHVSRVEDRHAGSYLLLGVELTDHVQGARIKLGEIKLLGFQQHEYGAYRSLCDAQKEASN